MKLFTHAQIGPKEQDMVRNLSFLGINIVSDVSVKHIFRREEYLVSHQGTCSIRIRGYLIRPSRYVLLQSLVHCVVLIVRCRCFNDGLPG